MKTPLPAQAKPEINFLSEDATFTGRFQKSVFATIYLAYKGFMMRFIPLLVVGFLARLLLLANANIIGYWVDSFCQTGVNCRKPPVFFAHFQNADFLQLLILMTTVGLISMALYRIRFSRLSAQAISSLYDETSLRVSRFPMKFFDRQPSGRIITRFSSDYNTIFRMFGGPLAEFLTLIFDLIAMALLLAIASPYYLVIILGLGLLNYFIYRAHRDGLRVKRRKLSLARAPSISHFAETAQGVGSIRAFQREKDFTERFAALDKMYIENKRTTFHHLIVFGLQMNLNSAAVSLVTGALGYLLIKWDMVGVGSIGVAFGFITLSSLSLQMFFDWLSQFEEALVGVERMDQYLRGDIERGLALPACTTFATGQPQQTRAYEQLLEEPSPLARANAEIIFANVSLRYGPERPLTLDGISFTIKAGERVGIVGRTGSGKSSLIQALFQLYPLETGRITIDGWSPRLTRESHQTAPVDSSSRTLDLGLFRQAIAYISQTPVIFSGSLRTNLRPQTSLPEALLLETLEQVGLGPWLTQLESPLDYHIEENGRNLSLGQRQLICMARCLLQRAPIVIMDEATSSVDPQTEELLVQATDRLFAERTQIIIAHRLSTLAHCDRILWLQNGRIKMFEGKDQVLSLFSEADLLNS